MKTAQKVIVVGALVSALATNATAQTNLQFTGVSATGEGAIRIAWASQSNHVYEIDEADTLLDTNTGNITWNRLYDNYPSQGTNTFWLDTGNYNLIPPIPHPKTIPMRFYRIVDQGPDNLISDEPMVSIVSPTNGACRVSKPVSRQLRHLSWIRPVPASVVALKDYESVPAILFIARSRPLATHSLS